MGGIVANNSSGMCCGVVQNAYHTLESLTFVLPSGTVIDTAASDADDRLRAAEPALWEGLKTLKARVEANAPLAARIRAKYRTKNTTGYSLNALIDFERPVDILAHLLVGAEGTLAFIAEAVLRTVPGPARQVHGAAAVPHDARGVRRDRAAQGRRCRGARGDGPRGAAVRRDPARQPGRDPLPARGRRRPAGRVPGRATRTSAPSSSGSRRTRPADCDCTRRRSFTHAAREQQLLWSIRKGMFPSVGAVRRSGTTVIIEDVAFPIETLADAAVDLTALMSAARLPRRDRLRPREGREPALRHVAVVQPAVGRRPVRAVHRRRGRRSSSSATTAPSRPSTARAGTWRRSWRPSGAPRPWRSCAG